MKGIMSKKKAAYLFKPGSAKYRQIMESDKEYYTDREIEDLMDLRPTFPTGATHTPCSHAELADDDKVHSYDNNFDLWR